MYHVTELESPFKHLKLYMFNGCQVLVGIEDGKWHLSISHKNRYPIYDEIKFARYKFCPDDVTMAMIFPPTKQFVNIHNNCFHLFEIEGE